MNVILLWHMHQPYYVNPLTKKSKMPWVPLHAANGYLDMIDLVTAQPELRGNFNFTPKQTNSVLDIHQEILGLVLPEYRAAAERGQIELTTTPYFHPIMPLVYDTNIARRCQPQSPLPSAFSAPEDVRAQLRLAQELHEQVFGQRARGLWPSEGSIAPEIIPLMVEAGFDYFCSDEGNL